MTRPTDTSKLATGFPAANHDAWRVMVDKALKGTDFDKRLVARTADGLRVDPLYTRKDELIGSDSALPGQAPYTRGTAPTRSGLGWDIRAIHIESDPKAANAAILEDLGGGVNSIALQIGGHGLPPTKEALSVALKDVLLEVCPIVLVAGEASFDAAAALHSSTPTEIWWSGWHVRSPTRAVRTCCT